MHAVVGICAKTCQNLLKFANCRSVHQHTCTGIRTPGVWSGRSSDCVRVSSDGAWVHRPESQETLSHWGNHCASCPSERSPDGSVHRRQGSPAVHSVWYTWVRHESCRCRARVLALAGLAMEPCYTVIRNPWSVNIIAVKVTMKAMVIVKASNVTFGISITCLSNCLHDQVSTASM